MTGAAAFAVNDTNATPTLLERFGQETRERDPGLGLRHSMQVEFGAA